MTVKVEYDFSPSNWAKTSFPSCLKHTNDSPSTAYTYVRKVLYAAPGDKIRVTVKSKQQKAMALFAAIVTRVKVSGVWKWVPGSDVESKSGTFDWRELSTSFICPPGTESIILNGYGIGPAPSSTDPCILWLDDLFIYRNDIIIYSNDFSKWDPLIGAGIGAPIGGVAGYLLKEPLGPMVSEAVGAVVGGAVGGGIGLLTGLGIIPVPQIPSLGAAPEEPEAPARLGKYQITG